MFPEVCDTRHPARKNQCVRFINSACLEKTVRFHRNPASAGHGLNLQQGGSILIWFGLTWSLELYQQTVARLWRQGQTSRTVIVQHIVTKGTMDERILKALEKKDSSQADLIEAVKADLEGKA